MNICPVLQCRLALFDSSAQEAAQLLKHTLVQCGSISQASPMTQAVLQSSLLLLICGMENQPMITKLPFWLLELVEEVPLANLYQYGNLARRAVAHGEFLHVPAQPHAITAMS